VQAHDNIIREIQQVEGVGYITCSNDESIKLWSSSLILFKTFLGHSGFIFTVKPLILDMFGLIYVSGSDDSTVKLWHGEGEII
jgi:phospholipase A-2-activating protein